MARTFRLRPYITSMVFCCCCFYCRRAPSPPASSCMTETAAPWPARKWSSHKSTRGLGAQLSCAANAKLPSAGQEPAWPLCLAALRIWWLRKLPCSAVAAGLCVSMRLLLLPLRGWNALLVLATHAPICSCCSPCAAAAEHAAHCFCHPSRPRSWVEQDPLAIWGSVQAAVQQAMEDALERYGALSVVAVGITNQREREVVGCVGC